MIINGKGVCDAIALGEISMYNNSELQVKKYTTQNYEEETKRLNVAIENSMAQLDDLYKTAVKEVGELNAQVFGIHKMILEDEDYTDNIKDIISNRKVNAEYAVSQTAENFANMFLKMDDDYMQARATDIKDVSERLIRNLSGKEENVRYGDKTVIIVAKDLAPSETVQLDKSKVAGFITEQGSDNSHTAILARTMNIPAIVNTGKLPEDIDGKFAVIDGYKGICIIEPDEEVIKKYRIKKDEDEKHIALLKNLKGRENITKNGKSIKVYANIGAVDDVDEVLQNDAGGIGLFRSEFLYLGKKDYPTEQEQFESYSKVLKKMGTKPVIVRTLDIGADKKIDYFDLPKEENPAMGFRAIRICLSRPELFKTQLRALYRASVYGNLSIMFPMITSVEEIYSIKAIVREVKNELNAQNIPFSPDVNLGIMIETPASALISDILAKEVDFFSIGTNDLIQYTLACDRQNEEITRFVNTHHQAVIRLIEMTVKNAHNEGIWVGICGEIASDTSLTEKFIDMGVDELSVSSPYVLKLREKIISI